MAFNGLTMTTKGINLLTKILAGTTAAFTKIKLGDGTLASGSSLEALTDLIDPKLVISLESVKSLGDGTWRVRGTLTNSSVTTGFSAREVGLFATDPDLGEILFAVANAGSECDYMPSSTQYTIEQVIDLVVAISNSSTVTIITDESSVFVSLATFNEHVDDKDNPHEVTAAQVGAPSLAKAHFWQASTAYAAGDICYSSNAASYKRMECVVAGTTGTTEPSWTAVGTLVTDNTVTWIVDDIRDGTPVGRPVFDMLIRSGYVELAGAAYSRSAYPRLWKFANDNGLTVSESDWAAGMYGLFSVGDGSTTFRVPKNAGEFIRALDTLQALDQTSITGTTTSGSATITAISSTVPLAVGMKVSGSGIPSGATIASIDSSTSITISASATATATSVALTITGRRLGSYQQDTLQNITGSFANASNTGIGWGPWSGAFYSSGTYERGLSGVTGTAYGIGFDASKVARTGNETRGHNVAYYGSIKY